MNPRFLSLACLALIFSSIAPADAQSTFAETASVSEMPFRLSSGYLIEVEGRIGDQDKLKFVLDTGATITIIDHRIADKLKLDRHPAESFNFDRKLNWDSAVLPDLQFGPVHANDIPVFIGRLKEYSEFVKNADAVIGMDLLRFSNFSVDLGTRKISFHRSMQKTPVVAGDPLLQCPMLEVQVQGHPVRLIVDTGLAGVLFYEERLRKKVPGLRTSGHLVDATIGTRVRAKQATIPDVILGKANRDLSVLLVASPDPEMLPGIDGIIGITALQAHHVSFDFAGKTLTWD